jgi:hypothetical protein
MRRREFIAALGGAAVAGPLAARAAIPVVGFLHSASPGPFARAVEGFHGGLNETGYLPSRANLQHLLTAVMARFGPPGMSVRCRLLEEKPEVINPG